MPITLALDLLNQSATSTSLHLLANHKELVFWRCCTFVQPPAVLQLLEKVESYRGHGNSRHREEHPYRLIAGSNEDVGVPQGEYPPSSSQMYFIVARLLGK